ncbi:cytochrome P450 CYP749A22-like [Cryptomeria japonica]|uniref:cytochrome P450 CYP749A22-like n=1 Tax=Cryptomeria japonica TaxID=3369 RepID=UPI0027D9FFB1|nr:cytochrome P450 CYP749A22-like [Cryptomeria japonica]
MDLNLSLWQVLSFVGVILTAVLVNIVVKIWWVPLRTQKFLRNQGINGPPYKLFYGSTKELLEIRKHAKTTSSRITPHDITPLVLPHIDVWVKQYGRIFVHWMGTQARIVVDDPEMMKQILSNKSGHYEKPEPSIQLKRLIGYGLASSNGEKWARQRRLLNPAFHLESLKSMVPVVAASTAEMLEKWGNAIAEGVKEIEVSEEFPCLTADVIARTAFGSSFEEGKHIFHMLAELTVLAGQSFGKIYFPGSRFIPIPSNLRPRKLDMDIQKSLTEMIFNRKKNVEMRKYDSYGTDLLGLMMDAYKNELKDKKNFLSLSLQDMVDECKTFFIAGSETTANLLTWTLILLGMHTNWQDKAREEVLNIFNKEIPKFDALSRLKLVNMIFYEVLRLYPPAIIAIRKAYKNMQLGNLTIPADVELVLPTIMVHHDAELWGKDSKEFNPLRFSEGISKASTHPAAFTSFGFGPRTCIGQNFALLEAKVILIMVLQRFSFSISPTYIHAPASTFTLRPLHGAQIMFQELQT